MNQGLTYDLQSTLKAVEDFGLLEAHTITVTRRDNPPETDASGWPDYSYPTTIISGIPCMIAVDRMKPDISAVTRTQDRFDTLSERTILIDGYFPQILQRDVATDDLGNTYEIMSVEHDSQNVYTRLAARLYAI